MGLNFEIVLFIWCSDQPIYALICSARKQERCHCECVMSCGAVLDCQSDGCRASRDGKAVTMASFLFECLRMSECMRGVIGYLNSFEAEWRIFASVNYHWFRQWLVVWLAPGHYLNQCWNIVNSNLTNFSKLTIIGSDNGLSPRRRQAIIWTNAGILLSRPL